MNDKKSAVEDVKLVLSRSPLELHADIIYTMCRNHIARIDSDCSRQADQLELIENIYFDLGEIKKILWVAVESSRSRRFKEN